MISIERGLPIFTHFHSFDALGGVSFLSDDGTC